MSFFSCPHCELSSRHVFVPMALPPLESPASPMQESFFLCTDFAAKPRSPGSRQHRLFRIPRPLRTLLWLSSHVLVLSPGPNKRYLCNSVFSFAIRSRDRFGRHHSGIVQSSEQNPLSSFFSALRSSTSSPLFDSFSRPRPHPRARYGADVFFSFPVSFYSFIPSQS